MPDRWNDDDRRRWAEGRARDAGSDDRPRGPDVPYGRHYGDHGRYTGGAPWGGRGDDRGYPAPEAARPRDDRPDRRPDPQPVYRGERQEWRPTEVRSTALLPDRGPDREPDRGGWLSRVKDEARALRGRNQGDDGRHRVVERRRVEPARWLDDDRHEDRRPAYVDDRPDSFDVEIADTVAAKLGRDRRLDTRFVEIAVYHGEVELTGAVLSKEGRRRAKRLAEEVRGVRDVDNHLKVEPWRYD